MIYFAFSHTIELSAEEGPGVYKNFRIINFLQQYKMSGYSTALWL